MQKNIKLHHSPFTPAMEVVGGMLLKVFVPYSDKHVTVQIAPNVQDYQTNLDKPGIKVRQISVTTSTDQSKTLTFDFGSNNAQTVEVDGKAYEIKLMHIGKEKMEGQDFPVFEFLVTYTA